MNKMQPREKINPQTAKRLFSYIGQYRVQLIFVVFCILFSSVAGVASSVFIQVLIDDYIVPILAMDKPVFFGLFQALCVMGAIYLVGILAAWLYNFLMVTVAQKTLKTIRDEMFIKMQSLPVRYFDTHTHGDLMSRYTNDTDTLRQMIAQSMAHLISSLFTLGAVFFCMLYQSVYLTVIVLVCIALMLRIVQGIAGKSGAYFLRQQDTLGSLDGYVEEMINGQKVVKVFCHEAQSREEFRRKNKEWEDASGKANGYANALMPMMNALGYVQYVIVAVAGAWFAISKTGNLSLLGMNTMTLGMIASFLTLSRNFTMPISQLASQFNAVAMALSGAERIFELLDEKAETDKGCVTLVRVQKKKDVWLEAGGDTAVWAWKCPNEDETFDYRVLKGNIVLGNVDFGYFPEKQVLSDVSVYAKPGQKVAFVGATGAGKTTITNLLNRFYDITDGRISYDGIDINRIKKHDLRRSLGIVLQEVNLFTGTVMENIRYGNKEASDEDCIAAARLANAHNFIMLLPKGYQTVLTGDGSLLSEGQKQLLSIARAAVSNPPVMILDEATSSIDTRAERMIQLGMDRLMEGRTVFVIAHRLSTVKNADVIIVLDQGRIVERGNHQELLARKGIYYQLYTGAFELE